MIKQQVAIRVIELSQPNARGRKNGSEKKKGNHTHAPTKAKH